MITPPRSILLQRFWSQPSWLVWIGFSKLAGPGVAALAYGTETIPKVDKITGPGNIFVATAKKMVYGVDED